MNLCSVNWRQGYEGFLITEPPLTVAGQKRTIINCTVAVLEPYLDTYLHANNTQFSAQPQSETAPQYVIPHTLASLIPLPPNYGGLFNGRDISSPQPQARMCPSYWWECLERAPALTKNLTKSQYKSDKDTCTEITSACTCCDDLI